MDTKTTVKEAVFEEIRNRIFDGEWNPGDKIPSEIILAKELGISRLSLREAIEKLVVLGVLTKKKGGGTFVNHLELSSFFDSLISMVTLDRDSFLDMLDYRLITEVESVRLCCKKCNKADIKTLEKLYNNMLENSDNQEVFVEMDMLFHLKIAEITGNTILCKINSILKSIYMEHHKVINRNLGAAGGLNDHKKILDAIKDKDSELAAIFMKKHIERTIKEMRKVNKFL